MKITFQRTGNVYLNAGIVGIAVGLERYEDDWRLSGQPKLPQLPAHKWGWADNALWVDTDDPKDLFERLYQAMGRVYYNTSTKDALKDKSNFYYLPDEDRFEPFPKMKTYGFGALLTNDASGKTVNKDNTIRKRSISEDDAFGQDLKRRYEEHFAARNLKLGQQLYVNEPYAKITRLILDDKDFKTGVYACPLTGEYFGRLHPAKSVSPTTSGMTNFLSGLSATNDKIGWKALYAVRFAPVIGLYRYTGGLDTLYCYFYDHPQLDVLHSLYKRLAGRLYLDDVAKQENNHLNNIKLQPLTVAAGEKSFTLKGSDFVHPYETLFQLVYTLQEVLFIEDTDEQGGIEFSDEDPKLMLYLLRADKFAGTTRPNTFASFNHFAYLIRYIKASKTTVGLDWGQVMASLKIHLPGKERDYTKERLLREQILKKLMHGQNFLADLKTLYLGAFNLKLKGEQPGWKRWKELEKLIRFQEFGPLNNHTQMEKNLREMAYKLGTQIGQTILNDESTGDKPSDRAKYGRKYVIGLDKARTSDELLEAIKRVQLRYGATLKRELILEEAFEENFRTIKLLATIGALNTINGRLNIRKPDAPETSN